MKAANKRGGYAQIDINRLRPSQPTFRAGHFDEPNVVAHVRMDDRTDADGKKVLFVEEVQSDWMQSHRKMVKALDDQWVSAVTRMKKDGRLTVKCP